MLLNLNDCQNEFWTASNDRGMLWVTKKGSVDIKVVTLGVVNNTRLLDAHYANLKFNIISYGKLEAKRCILEYRGGRRVLTSGFVGAPLKDFDCNNNVLTVAVIEQGFKFIARGGNGCTQFT